MNNEENTELNMYNEIVVQQDPQIINGEKHHYWTESDMALGNGTTTAMSAALIDHRWIRLRFQNGYFFKMGEFASPMNQLISAAPIKCAAQLETRFMGTSGIMVNAETY